jgi:hypothetical protein
MFDDEARLIELLGARYPSWRTISDDPYVAAEALGIRLPRGRSPSILDEIDGEDMEDTYYGEG